MAQASTGPRLGFLLSFVEAIGFGVVAALHFGAVFDIGDAHFEAPFLYPAGIVEGLLALALVIAVILPGDANVRGGRVLGAQILTVIGMFVVQVALMRGAVLGSLRNEIVYGVALILSLASIALIAAPAVYRHTVVHR
jgi:hypothetical protein